MPAAPIAVDTDTYTSAGELFLRANHDVCDVVAIAADRAQRALGMAGSDSNGAAWAVQYDAAARAVLQAGTIAADALGRIGESLVGSGDNHAGAEAASTVGGPPHYPGQSSAPAAESVLPSTPPSADGTPSDPPPGWFLVAHLLAWTWPNGHQDRLRAVARSWADAAQGFSDVADRLTTPIGEISSLRSPEIDAAVRRCTEVQLAVRRLAAGCTRLAAMCSSYADQLDETHSSVLRRLGALVAECAAIEAATALAAAATGGVSEAVAPAAVEARVVVAAAEITGWLARLAEVVDALAAVLREVVVSAGFVFASLATFVGSADTANLADVVIQAERAALDARLSTAPTWGNGNFPDNGPPNGLQVRRAPDGTVTHYAVYDADGLITRRVDLVGRAHGPVDTPHVVYYQHDRNPQTGRVHIRVVSWEPRTAYPEEIP